MAPRNISRVDNTQHGCVLVAKGIGAFCVDLHQMGKGIPDYAILYRGNTYWVEFKSEKGKLEEDQKTWHAKAEAAGIAVHVIRNPNEMLAMLTREEHEEL